MKAPRSRPGNRDLREGRLGRRSARVWEGWGVGSSTVLPGFSEGSKGGFLGRGDGSLGEGTGEPLSGSPRAPSFSDHVTPPPPPVRGTRDPSTTAAPRCHVAPSGEAVGRALHRTIRHVTGRIPPSSPIGRPGLLAPPAPTQPGAAVRCTRHVRLRRAGGRGCRWCGQGRRTMAEEPRTWWSDGSHVRSGKKRSEKHVPWE